MRTTIDSHVQQLDADVDDAPWRQPLDVMSSTVDGRQAEIGVLESKLCPPPNHVSLVQRIRLTSRLAAAAPASISLVAAPAGFGKTSLLSNYAASAQQGPIAWVSLDAGDGDPSQFWFHVAVAVHRACGNESGAARPMPASSASDVEDVVIPRLLNQLHRSEQMLTVILDDLHHLVDDKVLEQLGFVAERLPLNCRMILATRSEPELPLGRWRVTGKLQEIRADDLALTQAEAGSFLTGRLGLDLSPAGSSLIWSRAEGWPAGIYLTALGLVGRSNCDDLVESCSAQFDLATVDYMTSEVLATMAPEDRELLARLSILERMSGALADAVLDRSGSRAALLKLMRENLFVSAVDPACSWFRIHPTLRSFLRTELELTEPALVGELHRRAVDWYLANGSVADALSHAVAVADNQLLVDLVRGHWVQLVRAGSLNVLCSTIDRLDEAQLATDASLLTAAAYAALHTKSFDEVDRLVAAARRIATDETSTPLIELAAAARHLEAGAVSAAFDAVRMVLHSDDLAYHTEALASELAGTAAVWAGCDEIAEPLLRNRLAAVANDDEPVHQAMISGHLAVLLAERMDLLGARRCAEEGLRMVERCGIEDLPQSAMLHTAMGIVNRREGRPEEAIEHLERGVRAARGGGPIAAAYAVLALAGTLGSGADVDRARMLVAEARDLVEGCQDPGKTLLAAWQRDSRSLRRRSYRGGRMVEEQTERELEHLRLLPTELSRREIAERLMISYNTVKSNSRSIFRKLGVNSRTDAVSVAREAGLM